MRALRVILSPLGELLVFSYCRYDLAEPIELHDARIDINIGPLPLDQLDELVPIVWDSYHPARQQLDGSAKTVAALVRTRYATGATCFVARRDGRIVHYNWVFEQVFEGAEAVIELGPGEAHCDNGFTTVDSRGKGVHAAVNSRMLQFLRERGNHVAYTRFTTDNVSSKKALQKVGWDFYGELAVFTPRWSSRVFTKTLRGPLGPVRPRRHVGTPS